MPKGTGINPQPFRGWEYVNMNQCKRSTLPRMIQMPEVSNDSAARFHDAYLHMSTLNYSGKKLWEIA